MDYQKSTTLQKDFPVHWKWIKEPQVYQQVLRKEWRYQRRRSQMVQSMVSAHESSMYSAIHSHLWVRMMPAGLLPLWINLSADDPSCWQHHCQAGFLHSPSHCVTVLLCHLLWRHNSSHWLSDLYTAWYSDPKRIQSVHLPQSEYLWIPLKKMAWPLRWSALYYRHDPVRQWKQTRPFHYPYHDR